MHAYASGIGVKIEVSALCRLAVHLTQETNFRTAVPISESNAELPRYLPYMGKPIEHLSNQISQAVDL